MAADLGFLIRGSFEKACDEGVDVSIKGVGVDRNEVGQACDSMRTNFGIVVLSKHDELRNHEVEGESPVDLDVEFPRIILACLFENIKRSLRKLIQ